MFHRNLRLRGIAAALTLAAPLLAGCYEIDSAVPAITEASRSAELPIRAGRYCAADVDFNASGSITGLELTECVTLAVKGGTLTVAGEDPVEPETLTFDVADLTRGTRLMQRRSDEEWGYALVVALMREDSLVILDEPRRTPEVEEAAQRHGVGLAPVEEGELASAWPEIDIQSGSPEDVRDLVADAAGFMLDEALKDEELKRTLRESALFYVRVGTDVADSNLDPGAARKEVRALLEMAERAMALE